MEPKHTSSIYRAPRSEEVEEIINQPPAWLIRWGIMIFFAMVMLLLMASWFIRYPDFIRAPFRLTAQHAPKSITSKIDGKLIRLFVGNNSIVKQGTVMGYMESVGSHDEVLTLLSDLTSILNMIRQNGNAFRPLEYHQLGELQNDFQIFNKAYTQFLDFQLNGYVSKKRSLLESELAELIRMETNLEEQQRMLQENISIAEAEFKIQQKLAKEHVISPLDLRREESKLLEKKMPLKTIESSLYNNANLQISKKKEILEVDKLINEHQNDFLQSLHTLQSAAEAWKQKYVLTAPVNGRVYFSSFVEEKQNLTVNQEVFFIGEEGARYFGEVNVPQTNAGKVKVGQEVIVKFDSYPFYEFGAVKGKVAFISDITDGDNNFLVKVELPKGLVTSSGQSIQYKSGMNASAEIVTADLRLIERFFYRLRRAVEP